MYTPDEARMPLRMGRNRMYEALRAGEIPHIRNGRRYLIPAAVIDRIVAGESTAKAA